MLLREVARAGQTMIAFGRPHARLVAPSTGGSGHAGGRVRVSRHSPPTKED